MLWFHEDERKVLVKYLQKLSKEDEFLRNFLKNLDKDREEIADANLKKSKEVLVDFEDGSLDALVMLNRMIRQDGEMIHILVELRRKGTLVFQGNQDEESSRILQAVQKLHKELEKTSAVITGLKHQYTEEPLLKDPKHSLALYEGKLKVLVESEHKDVEEIETELRKGRAVTDKKLLEQQISGQFRIEIHKGYRQLVYSNLNYTRENENNFAYAILGYDNDYLVLEICLEQFSPEIIETVETHSFVRGRGYAQRAIEFVLLAGLTKVWATSRVVSKQARKMFDRILKNESFIEIINHPLIEDHLDRERVIFRLRHKGEEDLHSVDYSKQ